MRDCGVGCMNVGACVHGLWLANWDVKLGRRGLLLFGVVVCKLGFGIVNGKLGLAIWPWESEIEVSGHGDIHVLGAGILRSQATCCEMQATNGLHLGPTNFKLLASGLLPAKNWRQRASSPDHRNPLGNK